MNIEDYKPYLYGAYGSNMNIAQMSQRCPRAKTITSYELKDYELVFRGVADVIKKEGSTVMLGLWRITEDCEHRLDIYEGWPSLYRKEIIDTDIGPIMIYVMNEQEYIHPPTDRYLKSIADGYDDFGVERKSLLLSLNNSWTNQTA